MIHEKYEESGKRYGSPRITHALQGDEVSCSENTVAVIMAEQRLVARQKKRFKVTTDSNHGLKCAKNLLAREFTAEAPNQKWASDITYIRTIEGFMYLCVVIDLFSRRIVGWAVRDHMEASLIEAALKNALYSTGQAVLPDLLFHSDRGGQYLSKQCKKTISDYRLVQSMSRRGDCWDNAVVESFFSSLKIEEFYMDSTPRNSEVRAKLFDYIECFYNNKRLHSTLGYKSPADSENEYYQHFKQAA